jgi:hypothetical protein
MDRSVLQNKSEAAEHFRKGSDHHHDIVSRFTSLGDYIEGGAEAWEVMKDTIPHLRGSLSFIIETAKGKRKNMSSL